jgi:hypothetical protein
MPRSEASRVVNWGDDPDGDGVAKALDECPGTKGNGSTGCLVFQAEPVDDNGGGDNGGGNDGGGDNGGGDPAPATPAPPVSPPAAAAPVSASAPAPAPIARDTKAPSFKVTKLGRSAKRSLLTGRGLAPRIDCDEACSLTVEVKTRKRGARTVGTVLTKKVAGRSAAARTVRLKLKRGSLRRLIKQQVTLVITATDAAGNRKSSMRVVKLAR